MSGTSFFRKFIFSLLKVIGLILLCAVTAAVITIPVWLLAVRKPAFYTALVISALLLFILYRIIRSVLTKRKNR